MFIKKLKTKSYLWAMLACVLALSLFFCSFCVTPLRAENSNSPSSSQVVSLTNGDFNNAPNSTALDKSPSGWTKIITSSTATSGIINVGEKFSANASTYQLENNDNPGKLNSDYDNKILMINSKNAQGVESSVSQGYESANITLHPYSFYEISFLAYTSLNAYASAYLTGFDESITTNSIKNISTDKNWTEYTFYVQTNHESLIANLELYLGNTNSQGSIGVVFFDNVKVIEVSHERYFDDISNPPANSSIISNNINYLTQYQTTHNFDFETGATVDSWLIEGEYDAEKVVARVANLTDENFATTYGTASLGTDNTYNNKYGLVIALPEDNAGYVGYMSKNSIEIKQNAIYKISANIKVDNIVGNAFFNIVENNDVNEFYGDDVDFYTTKSESIKISSNISDKLKNNYTTASYYIVGHPLYDTSVKLGLFLGSKDTASSGTVVFDTITIEQISYEHFNNVSTSSTDVKIELTTITTEPSIQNAYFNSVVDQKETLTYPLAAKNWEQTIYQNEENNVWGIVNTNQTKWAQNGLVNANPRNPMVNINGTYVQTPITDTNNILMIYNATLSYQTLKSPNITLSKDSYYTLSFDFYSSNYNNNDSSILNVYLQDSNDEIVYEKLNLDSKQTWENFQLVIKTEYFSTDLRLLFEVGKDENNLAQGVVYLDNIILTLQSYTDEDFVKIAEDTSKNVLDLANMGFNIKSESADEYGIYGALMFEETNNNLGNAGIISEENEFGVDFPDTNENLSKNMIAISTFGTTTHYLTSKYDITLDASSYYKFSVYIKTITTGTPAEDEEHTFGAQFILKGLDGASISEIKSEDFEKFEIYAFINAAATINVQFALSSDAYITTGSAFFDNFKFEKIDEAIYNSASESENVLIFSNSTEEDEQEDPEEEENANQQSPNIWIFISTIIMTIAIVLAIILFFIRKIDFKKLERKKMTPSEYDRNRTSIRDASIKEAEKRRDQEIATMKKEITELENMLTTLEEENKARIEKERQEHGKQITRKAEKDFKAYVAARNRISKEIGKIEEQITEAQTPEYLLKLERIIVYEKTKQQKDKLRQQENNALKVEETDESNVDEQTEPATDEPNKKE